MVVLVARERAQEQSNQLARVLRQDSVRGAAAAAGLSCSVSSASGNDTVKSNASFFFDCLQESIWSDSLFVWCIAGFVLCLRYPPVW